MTEEELKKKAIEDLEKNVYCRLRPAGNAGVGVFAIRDIPQGTRPFDCFFPPKTSSAIDPEEIFSSPKIDPEVKQMVKDFYVISDGKLDLPHWSLNDMSIAFFVNASDDPNLETADGETFVTKRDIKKGEELTADYKTYAENVDF